MLTELPARYLLRVLVHCGMEVSTALHINGSQLSRETEENSVLKILDNHMSLKSRFSGDDFQGFE